MVLHTTDPRCGPWEGSDLEDTSKDFLPLFGLSQHSEGCPALGASFIPSIRPGVKHKPANSVKISDGWLLRNSNCFKCGSQQSNVPLRDEITTPWAHSLCALRSLCVGTAKGWVHWRNVEVLLLNPLASKSSTTPAWLGIPLRTPLGIALHSTKY